MTYHNILSAVFGLTIYFVSLKMAKPRRQLTNPHDHKIIYSDNRAATNHAMGIGGRDRKENRRVRNRIDLRIHQRSDGKRRRYAAGRFHRSAPDAAIRVARPRPEPGERALGGGSDHRSRPIYCRTNYRCLAGGRTRPWHFRPGASLSHHHMDARGATEKDKMIRLAAHGVEDLRGRSRNINQRQPPGAAARSHPTRPTKWLS